MNDSIINNTNPVIWALLDDRAGNRSQCQGVAKLLGLPYEVRELEYTALSALPNALKGASFTGLNQASKDVLVSPWPDIIIAAGRRTAPIARAIKHKSNGKTRLVQIMYPGDSGLSDFDLVCIPQHDKYHEGANILSIPGAPHGVTQDVLDKASEKWRESFSQLPSPRIAVIVGGSTRRKKFTDDMGRDLGTLANKMATDSGGSLLITTSRRSGEAGKTMVSLISAPHFSYAWGDQGDNPYFGYLALADAIIVTGDSVSMCSESCATRAPVYIYAPDGFVIEKHARLHRYLYDAGFARPLEGKLDDWSHPPLNAAEIIAKAIHDNIPMWF
ncbi:MAG: nucleoside-diphosphate sugar epimerase [Rhodospirillales bacterium]|jgi:uncharacterized protein|nr:nucleoside-diphosphate sugar epimerase [Rhodospirillales bacterium]